MGIFSAKNWISTLETLPSEDIKKQNISENFDKKISRSTVPCTGDNVFPPNNKSYILGEKIGDGKEGNIFKVENEAGRIAKIYKDDFCTLWRREKLKLMTQDRLNFNGICFPLEVLNNSEGQFAGFIMQEAKGIKLTELFIPKSQFELNFPDCNKQDLVKLAISILNKIKYLHKHNVIMGDISPRNIMFTSSDEVYFVDVDSCQYGKYPCRVGTPGFIAPELRCKKLESVMLTEGNENFSVAVIVFMLMMQGQYPFVNENIMFPSVGPWSNIWNHLPPELRGAFIDTFRKDGKHNTENTRFSVYKWLGFMHEYNKALPAMISENPENGKVYPRGRV